MSTTMDQGTSLSASQAGPPSQTPVAGPSPKTRRHSLSISFPRLFQSNTSSTSLAPSTAEGRPVPLDDATAAHRTSALKEISTNYPSRHRYTKSAGAQNTTYSQPVLVRTYSGPSSRHTSTARSTGAGSFVFGSASQAPGSVGTAASVRRVIAFRTPFTGQQNGLLSMARSKSKKKADSVPAKLPPVEAFSFKSMMASVDAVDGDGSINADLDRIAEICAKSRYSLSNQYEVHVAPHGSGAAFLASTSQRQQAGPTLQAVTSDDERNSHRHRKRKSGGPRRKSMAMGTLETIISSSGSSEEGKSKKKSAAEITDEVRGRAVTKTSSMAYPTSPSRTSKSGKSADTNPAADRRLLRRKSSFFATAVIENSLYPPAANVESTNPRSSANDLLSDPALPQTSDSHLEVRTEQEQGYRYAEVAKSNADGHDRLEQSISSQKQETPSHSHKAPGLSGWVPAWAFPPVMGLSSASVQAGAGSSHAEGRLRDLLKSSGVRVKGRSPERPT